MSTETLRAKIITMQASGTCTLTLDGSAFTLELDLYWPFGIHERDLYSGTRAQEGDTEIFTAHEHRSIHEETTIQDTTRPCVLAFTGMVNSDRAYELDLPAMILPDDCAHRLTLLPVSG